LIEAVFGAFILSIVCLVVNTGSRGGLIILQAEEGFSNPKGSRSHLIVFHDKARAFAIEQLEKHRKSKNSKRAFRYSQLLNYFDAHPSSII
jgi:hypothetical protein